MHTFPLTITKLDEVAFAGYVDAVIAPGVEGELTVLKDHIPLITTLKEGTIRVRKGDTKQEFKVTRGVLEVSKKGVTILL